MGVAHPVGAAGGAARRARELARKCDGMSSSVLYQRLEELTAAAIVEQREDGRYDLTHAGTKLGRGIASARPLGQGVGRGTRAVTVRRGARKGLRTLGGAEPRM